MERNIIFTSQHIILLGNIILNFVKVQNLKGKYVDALTLEKNLEGG